MYIFIVRGVNIYGEGAWSDPANIRASQVPDTMTEVTVLLT